MTMEQPQRQFGNQPDLRDPGRFLRLGHLATLTLSGQADFKSFGEGIARAASADRIALVRLYRGKVQPDVIVDVGGLDHRKMNDLVAIAADGEIGTLRSYTGDYVEKLTVLLGKTESYSDILFMACADPVVTEHLAAELAFLWCTRKKGLVARVLGVEDHSDCLENCPLLAPENPYRLTRAEARVCKSLADGLKPGEITERLGCSMATVRTHLRNIYSKTGLDGMVAVVHKLHTDCATRARTS